MSKLVKKMKYYSTPKYEVNQKASYKISRSKIELFMQCPRCFWLDARLKISRPSGPKFSINNAIDGLMKNDFDHYRQLAQPHPIMTLNNLEVIPMSHPKLNVWRNPFKGISYLHPATNLTIYGGIDDLWIHPNDQVYIVDYKATAKDREVNIDSGWQISYKRQVEIYQWLFANNGFNVSSKAFFVLNLSSSLNSVWP